VYAKKSKNGKPIIHCLFVDDLFSACAKEDLAEMEADRRALSRKYTVKDLGDAKLVLGMRVTRDRKRKLLWLDQEQYVRKLLLRHGMEECRTMATPSEAGYRLRKGEGDNKKNLGDHRDAGSFSQEEYASIVGGLQYAALSTRPDIAYQASVLSRYLSDPHLQHWVAAKRVLRYLSGTAALGLQFGGKAPSKDGRMQQLVGPVYSDADWAGDEETRRSTTGFVVLLGGGAVSWASKRQKTVALSSAEAEYMATAAATQEIVWVRTLLNELGYEQDSPTPLLCDNQAAIAMAGNAVHHSRIKHIDLRHHFIRERVADGSMRVQWVPSTDQVADLLTKPLGAQPLTRLRFGLMSAAPSSNQAEEKA
jgi:hypothetical protein